MHRRLQLDMRESPASDRRHGSRGLTQNVLADAWDVETAPPALPTDNAQAARRHAATREEDSNQLLNIQQVAAMLHVPVSWVYGRMRKRSAQRLPGIRLGKYWRFREEEIHRWIENQRGGDCVR
jgi:excisionase family DNA binding protein